MTASELVERLQKIIKEDGDFMVEFMDFGEYGSTWSYPIEKVQLTRDNKQQKVIGVY